MRDLRELLRPNLFGLTHGELRPATLRLGHGCVAAMWAWLALGLVLVAGRAIFGIEPAGFSALAALWLSFAFLLAATVALYLLRLLFDGWPRRGWRWRLPLAAGLLLVAAMAIAGGGTWGRVLWLWARA